MNPCGEKKQQQQQQQHFDPFCRSRSSSPGVRSSTTSWGNNVRWCQRPTTPPFGAGRAASRLCWDPSSPPNPGSSTESQSLPMNPSPGHNVHEIRAACWKAAAESQPSGSCDPQGMRNTVTHSERCWCAFLESFLPVRQLGTDPSLVLSRGLRREKEFFCATTPAWAAPLAPWYCSLRWRLIATPFFAPPCAQNGDYNELRYLFSIITVYYMISHTTCSHVAFLNVFTHACWVCVHIVQYKLYVCHRQFDLRQRVTRCSKNRK